MKWKNADIAAACYTTDRMALHASYWLIAFSSGIFLIKRR
jgi:hypothetical protein